MVLTKKFRSKKTPQICSPGHVFPSHLKKKILLISILKNSHRNLSCLSLFSFLRSRNLKVNLLFLPKQKEYQEKAVGLFIKSNKFSIVGISVMTDNFYFAQRLTSDIRKFVPQIHVVWGGIHPTLMPEKCLNYANSVCIGEGETTFLSLINKIFQNKNYSSLLGIGARTSDGRPTVNPPSPLINDLDSLPPIVYDWRRFYIQDAHGLRHFDAHEYERYSNYNGEDYTIMTSRGCPFSCTYCCNSFINELYNTRGRIRRHSVNHVINEIKLARKTMNNIQFINFNDDQFLTDRKWNNEFCRKYKKEINLPFIVRLCPGTFDDNDIKQLKKTGLLFVTVGIQSGSERTNRTIFKRRFDRAAIIQASSIFSKNGIHPFYDIIIHNDLENDSDRKKTIELLLELQKPFAFNFFALTSFPKTQLEQIYKERGIVPRTNPYDEKSYSNYDEKNFYFQLAYIIPYTSNNVCYYFLKHSNNKAIRRVLDGYYNETKDTKNKVTQAQKTVQSNPRSHLTIEETNES